MRYVMRCSKILAPTMILTYQNKSKFRILIYYTYKDILPTSSCIIIYSLIVDCATIIGQAIIIISSTTTTGIDILYIYTYKTALQIESTISTI